MGYTVFVLRYSHGKSAPSIFRLVANKSFFQFCIYAVLANMTAKKWETRHVTWYDQVLRNTFFHIYFFSVWPKTNWLSKKSIYRDQDRRPLSHRCLDLWLPLQRYAVLPLPVLPDVGILKDFRTARQLAYYWHVSFKFERMFLGLDVALLVLAMLLTTVLVLLLLNGSHCLAADFPISEFLAISLCLGLFLLIYVSICVKTTTSVVYSHNFI